MWLCRSKYECRYMFLNNDNWKNNNDNNSVEASANAGICIDRCIDR